MRFNTKRSGGGAGGGWEVSGREEVTMSLALLHMLNEMLSIHELL